MKQRLSIPLPPRMRSLDRDRRGYPIPANVLRDVAGEAVFTVNNHQWVEDYQMRSAVCHCGICGQPLEEGHMHFIGGPVSAFHPAGAYLDGPVHEECGAYALQVCPYLALPATTYRKRLDEKAARNPLPIEVTVDLTQFADKPPCYVMGRAQTFGLSMPNELQRSYFKPVGQLRPETPVQERFLDIQVWCDGVPMDDEDQAIALIRQGLEAVEGRKPADPRVQRVAKD